MAEQAQSTAPRSAGKLGASSVDDRVLAEHRHLLGLVTAGEPVGQCLLELCRGFERIDPTVRVAIMLVDGPSQRFSRIISPSLDALGGALAGAPVNGWVPMGGASAASASVPGGDFKNTHEWRSLCADHGLWAGFATPIIDREGTLLGLAFLGLAAQREPGPHEVRLGAMAADLAALLLRTERSTGPVAQQLQVLQRAFEAVPVALYLTDAQGRVTFSNETAVRLWGKRPGPNDLWCGSWRIFRLDNSRLPLEDCPMAVALRERRPVYGEVLLVERPDGSRRLIAPNPSPLFDEAGRLMGAVNILLDITDERRSLEELRRSEQRYRSLAEATASIVWTTDAEGRFTGPQPSLTAYTGHPWELLRENGAESALHPEDRARLAAEFLAARETRTAYRSHGRLWHAGSGTYRRFEARGVPVLDASGEVREWVGTCVDIEAQHQAQEAVRRSEERYRAIIESQAEMVCRFRPDGTILFANGAYARTRAQTPDSLVGANLWAFVHPDDAEHVVGLLSRICPERPEVVIENRFETSAGARWTLWTNRGLAFDAQGKPTELQSTGVDITDRKRAEDALRESEARFRTMADHISQFAWMTEPDGWISWYNRRWYDYTGTTYEQMQGWGWTAVHHPDHVERVVAGFQKSLAEGTPWEDTFPLRGTDGEYRWFLSRAVPIRDAEGRIVRWFGTNTDITERREIEQDLGRHKADLEAIVEKRTHQLRETFERLRMSERLAMMGTLSAGLGHDMGNLLLPMRLRLESLAVEPLSGRAREDLDAIASGAEYLRRLASGLRLLALDPERAADPQPANLAAWWADAQGLLRSVLPRGVALEHDIAVDLPDADISRAALTQVVFNLVQNSADAMRDRASGRVLIRARGEEGVLALSVSDNGCGMAPEVRARCMEPFYTTKTRGRSTGLGLALVYGLVRDAGGQVDLASEPGVGTTFTLRLRARDAASSDLAHASGLCAVVALGDLRMQSLVTSELRAMGVRITGPDDHEPTPTLFVLDDPARIADLPEAASVLFFGQTSTRPGRVRCLGSVPRVSAVRSELMELLRSAHAFPAAS